MKKVYIVSAIIISVLVCFSVTGPSFAKGPPPEYFIDESKLPFDALPGAVAYWGIHSGAAYQIEVPSNWNGDLVLYCHGYRGNGLELTVSQPSIRLFLIENGYAWAASSYSKNAYDVKAGVKDTHDLAMFFNGLIGKPNRRYIIGHSMGGHITAVSIEQYPNVYDGALPMCGVMGDYDLFDYFMDYHLVALYLTGMDVVPPFPEDYLTVTVPAMQAILGNPYPNELTQEGVMLKTALKYISGGERPMFEQSFLYSYTGANFLFGQVMDPAIVENLDTIYQLDDDTANMSAAEMDLNANIYRDGYLPQTRKHQGIKNVPLVSGNITIPVISLHTLGDLFVPFVMEQIYAERVAAQGKSDLLVQRAIRDINHCGFNTDEQVDAFMALVLWVEEGIKPDGDDVLDPEVVADPNYGCQFTVGLHYFAPSCTALP